MTNDECFWKFSTLSDQELEVRLESLVSSERRTTARLVAHLAEVLERRLHLKQAFGSMTAYCREKLRLREDDAGRRIVAARLGTYKIEFTAGAELKAKLDLARDLMSQLSACRLDLAARNRYESGRQMCFGGLRGELADSGDVSLSADEVARPHEQRAACERPP